MQTREFLGVIFRRRRIVIWTTVIVTGVAVVLSLLQSPTYRGEARVLVAEQNTGAALFGQLVSELANQPERALQTQVELAQLRPIAESVIATMGLDTSPEGLLERVTVSAVGQTNVVVIGVTDDDPERAAETANALAAAYVAWSRDHRRASIRAALDEVERRLAEVEALIEDLEATPGAQAPPGTSQAELQTAAERYAMLAEKAEELLINEQLETGSATVVAPAVADQAQVSPNTLRNGVLGLVLGLALGLGLAFLAENLDETIKSSDDVEAIYGAPVLGRIPTEDALAGGASLAVMQRPQSPASQAYGVLRNNLDYVNFEHDIETVLVASAEPGEGKSTVAANLAAALAMSGKRVLLLDCDFHQPTLVGIPGIRSRPGLSDVLVGRRNVRDVLQQSPDLDDLWVMPAGQKPPNPSELLGSDSMESLVEDVRDTGDWLIVDVPPLLAVADATTAVRWADGVLMIVREGKSTRSAAGAAREMLDNVGARLLGVVIIGVEGSSIGGYGGYGLPHPGPTTKRG